MLWGEKDLALYLCVCSNHELKEKLSLSIMVSKDKQVQSFPNFPIPLLSLSLSHIPYRVRLILLKVGKRTGCHSKLQLIAKMVSLLQQTQECGKTK